MTPISTAPTDIEEVLVLRGGKRINSNVRKKYSSSAQRKEHRSEYKDYLTTYSLRKDVFKRWVEHIRALLTNEAPLEENVLEKGYF